LWPPTSIRVTIFVEIVSKLSVRVFVRVWFEMLPWESKPIT
jgi:hypothetical protein